MANHINLRDERIARLVFENALEYAIFTLAYDGTITSWSPGAEKVTGYSEQEAVGANFSRLFMPSDLEAGADKQELETAQRLGRAEDSRWHVRKDGRRFWANGMTMVIREPDSSGFLKVMRDETRSRLAEEQRVLLLNELNHRINNTLATVQSIAEQTLRSENVPAATRANLTARLMTLAEAHQVLVDENWAGADLHSILAKTISPHVQEARSRFRIDGPDVRLSPRQAVSMALVTHELATNALKYGALSHPDGWVAVDWNLAHDGEGGRHVSFSWVEHGGPPVAPPTRRGFGTRLLARAFNEEDGVRGRIDFDPGGLRCFIHLALSTSAESALDLAADPPRRGSIAARRY